jgi:hypothetical protein
MKLQSHVPQRSQRLSITCYSLKAGHLVAPLLRNGYQSKVSAKACSYEARTRGVAATLSGGRAQ